MQGRMHKAPGWFVTTWAVLAIGVGYGLVDGHLSHDEAVTALGLAVGWAVARGAFMLVLAQPGRR